jgi:two-component system sensor histidine kinase CiaH
MTDTGRKRIRRTTVIYWTLLLYIIAALVWWFISLEQQNDIKRTLQENQLNATVDSLASPKLYSESLTKIYTEHKKNKTKYIGEGSLFFLIILVGAVFVYRSFRRQFYMQQQQQQFMMAVTHELKTPISVARLNLETLQKYSLDEEKRKKLIRMTLQETARLNFLTNNILISAQMEGARYKSSKEELDLSDLLKDCMQDFKNRYPEREFVEKIESDTELKGDPLLLQMLINNLVENAIKYSAKEKPITAVLQKRESGIQLQVIDLGPGISNEEKKRIFTKFYRIGNEATRKTQGTGLGLYLSRKIAKDHNADIMVTDNKPSGCNFTVTFHS